MRLVFFFFNDTATTEIYTLSLHDALPTSPAASACDRSEPWMIDALGRPQSLLLLGGTSEIALAVARAWADARPVVTLAARPGERRTAAAAALRASGLEVHEADFEAEDTASHPGLVEAVAVERDLDVAVVAFGVLGDEEQAWTDHEA